MITGELKSQVDNVWNAFWTGGISNPLTVIEQFTYLLFIKGLDDRQQDAESSSLLLDIPLLVNFFTPAQQPLRWSSFKQLDPDTLYAYFTTTTPERPLTVFEHMKQVGSTAGAFAQYMQGATFLIPNARLLDIVVRLVDQIDLRDRDTKGDLYEYLLGKLATAGTNGQFRTPRHIIAMMVALMQPQQQDVICDPSCGTAGFLVGAGEYITQQRPEWLHSQAFLDHYNRGMFVGLEFDPSMLRIASMNLQLHGIEHPEVYGLDALSTANELSGKVSLILANPPFKGSLDEGAVEPSLLRMVKTKKTELLFLALMLRMLKVGGRCAVIVPDGVLFGSSKAHQQIRQELVQRQKLEAVISMPSGVFKPYAGVSTAILIFTKTQSGGTDRVWFYDMQADGYSLDDKRAPIAANDIPDILQRFGQWAQEGQRARSEQSFMVPYAEIEANGWDLSINKYKEVVYEAVQYESPAQLLSDIRTLDAERVEILKVLEGLLG